FRLPSHPSAFTRDAPALHPALIPADAVGPGAPRSALMARAGLSAERARALRQLPQGRRNAAHLGARSVGRRDARGSTPAAGVAARLPAALRAGYGHDADRTGSGEGTFRRTRRALLPAVRSSVGGRGFSGPLQSPGGNPDGNRDLAQPHRWMHEARRAALPGE